METKIRDWTTINYARSALVATCLSEGMFRALKKISEDNVRTVQWKIHHGGIGQTWEIFIFRAQNTIRKEV